MNRKTQVEAAGLCAALLVWAGCERNASVRPDPIDRPPDPIVLQLGNEPAPVRVSGQVVYVPVYSQIYHHQEGKTIDLAVTLSIRNTDLATSLSVLSVGYYDTAGELLREFVPEQVVLGPLASTDVVIDEYDRSGGPGANFIVEWLSDQTPTPPVIEAVMIGTGGGQGISFRSPGHVIRERRARP